MNKLRCVNTKYWDDTYIIDLTPVEKLLFLYFLTNPLTNICGIYEISLRRISFDTDIPNKDVLEILKKFEKDGKIFYLRSWVTVVNFQKHQVINESIKKGIENSLQKIPNEIFSEIKKKLKDLTEGRPSGTEGRPSETDGIVYNIIKDNIKSKVSTPQKPIPEQAMKLAKLLYELIKKHTPEWYVKPNWDMWASDIDKINRLDKRSYELIEWMIRWTQNDDFWKTNIQSPYKLREKFNTLILRAKPKQKDPLLYD